MPLLLTAAPSFLPTWYEVESDHLDRDVPGGRLRYLDAGAFARHVVDMYRSNHQSWLKAAFEIIERMHTDGDGYGCIDDGGSRVWARRHRAASSRK